MKLLAAILLSLSFPVFAQTPAPAPAPAPAAVSLKAQLSKTPLSGVILPQVTLDQASVEDAIGVLTSMVDTETKGVIKLQWIDKAFDRKKWPTKVNISGKGLSAGKLMSDILEQAGLEARLEDHAIILTPKTKVVERRVVKEGKPVDGKVESGPERDSFPKNPLVK
ncbi:hypothetical protein [Luteolibacter soli]|uniref:Uncharacterized protein n=1 Tax=Luteolibacter soli TaxID=3135280 RepID=A0ABU9AW80_9BACT